jgi:hypothetical protein
MPALNHPPVRAERQRLGTTSSQHVPLLARLGWCSAPGWPTPGARRPPWTRARGERLVTQHPASARGGGTADGAGWSPERSSGRSVSAHCSTTHNTAQEMLQSANQILYQLEAAGAATMAASQAGSSGGVGVIVSGYASSTGSVAAFQQSGSGSDSLSSMDEYSSSQLPDFSDLANEEQQAETSAIGEGASGGYGKANYEVRQRTPSHNQSTARCMSCTTRDHS